MVNVLTIILSAFAVLALNVQHSASALYLLLVLMALLLVCGGGRSFFAQGPTVPLYLVSGFALYPLVVVLQYVLMADVPLRALDVPLRFLCALPLLYVLPRLPQDAWAWLQRGAALGLYVALSGAMYQISVLGESRALTYFTHPTSFGNLSLIFTLIASGLLYRGRWDRALGFLALLAGLLNIYLSQTRGAWMALLLVLVAWFVGHPQIRRTIKGGLLVLVLLGVLLAYQSSTSIQTRLQDGWHELTQPLSEVSDTPVGLRRQYWQASWQMIEAHPWTGVGRLQFPREKQALINQGVLTPAAQQFDHPHNELLYAWSELGVGGLLALLALWLCPAIFFSATVMIIGPRYLIWQG